MTQKIQNMVDSWLWKVLTPFFGIIFLSMIGFIVTQGVSRVEAIAQESKTTNTTTLNNQAILKVVQDKIKRDRQNHKALKIRVDSLQKEHIKSNAKFIDTLHKIELHMERIDGKLDNLRK